MRRVKFVLPVFVLFALSGMAWGFGPQNHITSCEQALNDPYVMDLLQEFGMGGWVPLISGQVNRFDNDLRHPYHDGQWAMTRDRGYWYDSKWGNLSETTRIAGICHNATDNGVPLGHSPACSDPRYVDTTKEAILEARADLWLDFPGTTYLTGNRAQRVDSFYNTTMSLASWTYHNCNSWLKAMYGWQGQHCMWQGLANGVSNTQAVLVDYFLLQKPVVAEANGHFGYWALPGGDVTFSSEGSYDPDNVVFNSDGSYYNDGTGLWYGWDINGDGLFDSYSANPTFSYDQIISLVGPSYEWRYFDAWLAIEDDDGERAYQPLNTSIGYDSGILCVAPINYWEGWGYAPEPSSMVLLAMAGGWLFRRRSRRP